MSENKALVPVEQRAVTFYGDELTAVRLANGLVFVPVRPICALLGVDWNGQRRRINRDPVLSAELATVDVTSTEGDRAVTRGVLCLPLDYISGFLFGLNADRVRADLRDKVIRYQRECYKVLADAFQEGRLTAEPDFESLLQTADPATIQAYQIAQAMLKLARQQIMLEAQQGAQQVQLDAHERRLETIESQLGDPARRITPDQATAISQAVKMIAMTLSKRSGRNEYGAVWGELYRRFRVPSYRELPLAQYDAVMAWLTEWHQSLSGDEPF
ncbi:MAG: phage antirepressor N-terminal domain-containing protein [Chloroflexota bacterium]|nr:ORF6C domain-containing protein [Ardenticatenaceae bacterium]MCB8992262.1 ORF6C domain-containing protein [Ardenticatenaceae bacterium]